MPEDKATEAQIFDAARTVFMRDGYAGARMQAIADEAGINKSMLHYYYRSKDKLFFAVFKEGLRRFFPVIFEVLTSDLPLIPKIEKLVDTYHGILLANPHLPAFIVHEMNQHPERFREFMIEKGIGLPDKFRKQVEAEVKAGTMRPMPAEEVLLNVVSLCVFPIVARPMAQALFNLDDEQFIRFLEQRRKRVAQFILNGLKQK